MYLLPLGTGGFIPNQDRETSSYLIRSQDDAILFDLGTGLARLMDERLQHHIQDLRCINVMLSHYHLDHLIGLTWLARMADAPLRIYAPTKPWVEADAEEALRTITNQPYFGLSLNEYPHGVEIIPITEKRITVGRTVIHVIPQDHPGGSLGFRIDDKFAYITDTDPDRQHIEFMKDMGLVLVDTMYDEAGYKEKMAKTGKKKLDHGYPSGVAQLCGMASVSRMGLIHIDPFYGERDIERLLREATEVFKNAFIPREGEIYTL